MTLFLSEHDAARLGIAGATKRGRNTRPDIPSAPRAAKGAGDRVPDLMKLAAAGWTCTHYDHASGMHWLSSADGRETPRQPTYRAMLDEALKL